jgi:hypothetical protein
MMSLSVQLVIGAGLLGVICALGLLVLTLSSGRARARADQKSAEAALHQTEKVIDVQTRAAPDDRALDRFLRRNSRAG